MASLDWEDSGQRLVLRAACHLQAGVLLNGAVLLVGSDAERVTVTGGPESLAMLARMTSGVFTSYATLDGIFPECWILGLKNALRLHLHLLKQSFTAVQSYAALCEISLHAPQQLVSTFKPCVEFPQDSHLHGASLMSQHCMTVSILTDYDSFSQPRKLCLGLWAAKESERASNLAPRRA